MLPMEVTPKGAKFKSAYCSPSYSVESSPSEFKEETHPPKLSASLRERLKRTRRSFISPLSVAKRLCVDHEEQGCQKVAADSHQTVGGSSVVVHSADANRNTGKSEGEKLSGSVPEPTLVPSEDFIDQLRKEVKEKTETLRRLKMVKMYRSKNDLTQLQSLINKWRSCSQAALYELQLDVPIDGRKANLSELMDLFGLDDSILHFDRTEEDFTL